MGNASNTSRGIFESKIIQVDFYSNNYGICKKVHEKESLFMAPLSKLARQSFGMKIPGKPMSVQSGIVQAGPHTLKLDGIYHFVMITYGRSSITDNNFN